MNTECTVKCYVKVIALSFDDDDHDVVVADDYDNCILSMCIKYIKI